MPSSGRAWRRSSLPTLRVLRVRERGLKPESRNTHTGMQGSLPTLRVLRVRERGLKPEIAYLYASFIESLPTLRVLRVRERGLKPTWSAPGRTPGKSLPTLRVLRVRERGLKRLSRGGINWAQVAPRAGAWIETFHIFLPFLWGKSLPVRERGLKLIGIVAVLSPRRRSPCGSVD
jgi:hypothetical protein